MPSRVVVSLVVLGAAVLYQLLGPIVFKSFGILRSLQPLSDFPYTCRRIHHEDLRACEDIWIDEEGRQLFAACSTPETRQQWMPSVMYLNTSGRALDDHVSVLNIDEPGKDGKFGVRRLKTVGYEGATGDQSLDLLGFDAEKLTNGVVRLWMVNMRPSVDETKAIVDQSEVGPNSTIEVFDVAHGSDDMIHVKTVADRLIWSPNNLALDGEGGFWYTNDRSSKVERARTADFVLGGGNVGHCPPKGRCTISQYFGFTFPNGLVKGNDGLVYVPSAFHDQISVMKPEANHDLNEIKKLRSGMPVDNMAVDSNGDIWAAGVPKSLDMLKMWWNPYRHNAPSTIWKISKGGKRGKGYEIKKMLEDREAKTIAGVTTVRHDVKTGRLFLSSVMAPYIMVCDPK